MANVIYSSYIIARRKKRPGVHAKTKTSRCVNSVNYVKRYRGQGR